MAVVLTISALVILIVGLFSKGGRVYAGFAAALLGASYLLSAWVRFMRARGREVLPKLKLPSRRRAPYFHRNDKTDRPGIRSVGYHFADFDGLDDEAEETAGDAASDVAGYDDGRSTGTQTDACVSEQLTGPQRQKAVSAAYAICGALLLTASLFIA